MCNVCGCVPSTAFISKWPRTGGSSLLTLTPRPGSRRLADVLVQVAELPRRGTSAIGGQEFRSIGDAAAMSRRPRGALLKENAPNYWEAAWDARRYSRKGRAVNCRVKPQPGPAAYSCCLHRPEGRWFLRRHKRKFTKLGLFLPQRKSFKASLRDHAPVACCHSAIGLRLPRLVPISGS